VPYLLAAGAQVYFLLTGRRDKVRPARFVRDLTLALLAFGFTFWLVAGAGYAAIYQGVLFLFAGILVYAWMAARRAGRQEETAAAVPTTPPQREAVRRPDEDGAALPRTT
jgi:APA family basic amino acid/polyamine antiporter